MPNADFGQKTPLDKIEYVKLEGKGQDMQFRFVKGAVYDGKHFIKDAEGKYTVSYCPRIMNQEPCNYCEEFFEILAPIKDMDKEEDKKEIEALRKQAEPFKTTITFYYPIIDRRTKSAKILKTTQGVRIKVEDQVAKLHIRGKKITDYDYILTRTESPGSGYYELAPVDSEDTEVLDEAELNELAKAKEWDLASMVISKKSGLTLDEDETDNEPKNTEAEEDKKEAKKAKKPVENADLSDLPF